MATADRLDRLVEAIAKVTNETYLRIDARTAEQLNDDITAQRQTLKDLADRFTTDGERKVVNTHDTSSVSKEDLEECCEETNENIDSVNKSIKDQADRLMGALVGDGDGGGCPGIGALADIGGIAGLIGTPEDQATLFGILGRSHKTPPNTVMGLLEDADAQPVHVIIDNPLPLPVTVNPDGGVVKCELVHDERTYQRVQMVDELGNVMGGSWPMEVDAVLYHNTGGVVDANAPLAVSSGATPSAPSDVRIVAVGDTEVSGAVPVDLRYIAHADDIDGKHSNYVLATRKVYDPSGSAQPVSVMPEIMAYGFEGTSHLSEAGTNYTLSAITATLQGRPTVEVDNLHNPHPVRIDPLQPTKPES